MPSATDNPASYVFLSYASADRDRAVRVADLLEARGISVWIDRKSIAGGTSWSAEIVRGIEGCFALAVVCSEVGLASPNVQQEIQLAWESRKPILPLLLAPVQPPAAVRYALAGRQWIDVANSTEELWLPRVVEAILGLRIQTGTRPATEGTTLSPGPTNAATLVEVEEARHNLPVETTSFVGREKDLAEIRNLLETTHLLTLTGAGGSGKTRLALKLAEGVVGRFPDGVWLVELAPLADPLLVPYAVASVLAVRETPGSTIQAALHDRLRPLRLLLVVDNCEHLVDASARLVGALLRGCPHLKILTTSREILGVPGETAWRVPSLPIPDPRELPPGGSELVDAVESAGAARLFVERARQIAAGFRLNPENALNVARICYRLDGIPLAIELAVARLRTLAVDQLAARLDNRFRMLTGGSRTALRRQQTLRALVDWSHDLLSEREQELFRRLAVFAGGWQLEAAEEICGFGDLDPSDVLDLLGSLVDKSLVVIDHGAAGTERFRLLETLREYAMEKLAASGEAETARQRHGAYYLTLATPSDNRPHLEWSTVSARLVVEYDNFRAAVRWFSDADDWEGCLRLIGWLALEWLIRGLLSETRPWIEAVLNHIDAVSPMTRAIGLSGAGRLAFGQGDFATAIEVLRESVATYRRIGDNLGAAATLTLLGAALRDHSDLPEAAAVLEEALRESRSVGEQDMIAEALFQMGLLARQSGDLPRAEALLNEVLGWASRDNNHTPLQSLALHNLGLIAEDQDQLARARELYAQGMTVGRNAEFHYAQPFNLEGFATVASRKAQMERTLVLAAAAASARERLGTPIPPWMKPRLDRMVAEAREQLGEDAATAAWDAGKAMSLDRAIAYALADEAQLSDL